MRHFFRMARIAVPRCIASGFSAALLLAIPVVMLSAGSVEAKVRIMTRPDGTKVILDESRNHRGSRPAGSLLAVSRSEIGDLINYYANDRGLNPRLVQAVIQVESAYNPRARSRKGAMGLMQLMPDTARQLKVTNAYDPGENIRGGTLYLRRQLDRFSGDLKLALAAYNAGPGAVTQYGGVPPYAETRNYVRKVLSLYRGRSAGGFERTPRAAEPRSQTASAQTASAQTASAQTASAQTTVPAQTASIAQPTPKRQEPGKKVYMSRGGNNRIVFTTAQPKSD